MSWTDLEYSGTLTIMTCWCGMRHAVPTELYEHQRRMHDNGVKATPIYCPLGHTHIPAGESKSAKLERQLQRERARHDQTKAELETTERKRRAQKAQTTKLKNRIAHGVCPCCKRTFKDLAKHMANKHPEYSENDD